MAAKLSTSGVRFGTYTTGSTGPTPAALVCGDSLVATASLERVLLMRCCAYDRGDGQGSGGHTWRKHGAGAAYGFDHGYSKF